MPIFEYQQRRADGRTTVGTLTADSPRGARDQLRRQGVVFESVREVARRETAPASGGSARSIGSLTWLAWFSRGARHSSQVSWFVRELSTLIRVGTPVVDALSLAIEQARGEFRRILQEVREQVVSGRSLATALRSYPEVFETVLTEMVAVGEQSGALPEVLSQAARYRERKERLRDRVLSALLYPALVLVLSVAVSIFLMTTVVPTLIRSLEELGRELPWPTQILKSCSDGLLKYGIPLAGAILVSITIFLVWRRTKSGAMAWDRFLLRLPLIGSLVLRQDCSRLAMVTGTLLRSGVELVRAMEIAHGAVNNSRIAEVFQRARTNIAGGTELATALRSERVLPPALVQVFDLGQHTGELEGLLFEISEDYDHQVKITVERLTTLLEPLLIIGLSIVVGFILLATLLPILETGHAISDS